MQFRHYSSDKEIYMMTASILAIGLDPTLTRELTQTQPEKVIVTDCCDEAINVLRLWDVTTILIDANASETAETVETDVDKLLSVTPVTTQIILITPATNVLDNRNYAGLGVTTLTNPVSTADLAPYIDQTLSQTP